MLKEAAKNGIRVLGPPFIRNLPIAAWPGWLGRTLGVKVPKSVIRKSVADPTGQANINILIQMIERTRSLSGAVADVGVYKAASTAGMALYMRQCGIRKRIYAFDSFEGFEPDSVTRDLELGGAPDEDRNASGFSDCSLDEVNAKIRSLRLDNITLVPGYFNHSFKTLPGDLVFSFVHLDVNLYDSYRESLAFFYPKVEAGGVILFDEYNDPPWPGCNKAVDEFLLDKGERLEMISKDNYQKWFFVKRRSP